MKKSSINPHWLRFAVSTSGNCPQIQPLIRNEINVYNLTGLKYLICFFLSSFLPFMENNVLTTLIARRCSIQESISPAVHFIFHTNFKPHKNVR